MSRLGGRANTVHIARMGVTFAPTLQQPFVRAILVIALCEATLR